MMLFLFCQDSAPTGQPEVPIARYAQKGASGFFVRCTL